MHAESPVQGTKTDHDTASFILSLKGSILNLTDLLNAKKFRTRGNKPGALRAFKLLEQEGLGTLDSRDVRGTDKVQHAPACMLEC